MATTIEQPQVKEAAPQVAHRPVLRVQARPGWLAVDLRELWHYRELLGFLVGRDLRVRYKQTVLGAAWAILQPVVTMIVFTIFFGKLAKMPSDGAAYPLFAYCALLPWQFFASSVTHAGNSLVDSAHIITKIYFPRLMVPTAAVVGSLVDLAIALLVLVGLMAWYGTVPGVAVLVLPALLLLALVAAVGVGLWLAALNVQYRDVRYTIPFLMQVWMFLTPVVYPASLVPEQWRTLYGLNPMTSVVEGFRWALLGTPGPQVGTIMASIAMALVMLISGLVYFRRMEKTFADVI